MSIPSFQYSVYQPEYLIDEDSLVIKYTGDRSHQLTIDENGNSVDQDGNEFVKKPLKFCLQMKSK